jgi:hypothetical protein
MTSGVVAADPAAGIGSLGVGARSLVGYLVLVVGKLKRVTLPPAQGELLHLAEYGVAHFGAQLLAADSVDDLEDRLDTLLEDPTLLHLNGLMLEGVTADFVAGAAAEVELARLAEDAFGLGLRPLLEEGDRLTAAMLSALADYLGQLSDQQRREVSLLFARTTPSSLWTDPEIPAPIAHGIVNGLLASLCTFAIARALSEGIRVEPWLARALLECWVGGLRAYIRLMASVPGVRVREELVPCDQRFDLVMLEAQAVRARQTSDSLLEGARVHGAAVYPPHAEPGDD